MVWKNEKIIKRLEIEKVVKSGFSGKFSKETDFPKTKEKHKDFGQFDFDDHQLEEKEKRDLREMREMEKRGLL